MKNTKVTLVPLTADDRFQIDEFWCEYFKPTCDIPDDATNEGPDEMFHFIKV